MPYKDPQKQKESARRRYLANPDPYKERAAKRAKEHPEEGRAKANRSNAKRRLLVIENYGSECVCCGEAVVEFLGIDHIANNGAEHREEIGGSGSTLYKWLKKNNFPKEGFQLLCYNCNQAKESYGECVHKALLPLMDRKQRTNFRLRTQVIAHYGDRCICCGIAEPAFLSIDHINGGGKKHRQEVGHGSGFYYWLQRNNYPSGFQVMCYNCNHSKGSYGVCPHQKVMV